MRVEKLSKYARCIFLLVLGTCFLLQVREQFLKFMDKETATMSTFSAEPKLIFPDISVCPVSAMSRRAMANLGLPSTYWDTVPVVDPDEAWKVPRSREQAQEWWNATTLGLEDILDEVSYLKVKDGRKVDSVILGETMDSSSIRIRRLDSYLLGSCYVLSLIQEVVDHAEYFLLKFNFPEDTIKVRVYVSEHGTEEIGLEADFWVTSFQSFELVPNEIITVGLVKSVRELNPLNNECRTDTTTSNFTKCIKQESLKRARTDLNASNCCYMPGLAAWTSHLNACPSHARYKQAGASVAWTIHRVLSGQVCAPSCRSERYEINHQTFPLKHLDETSQARIAFHYTDVQVAYFKDKVLFDFNAILAAVGGSMGLFLGFSFYQFAIMAFEMAKVKLIKLEATAEE